MVRITKERMAKMEKKRDKTMEKKDLLRIASMLIMILLLPLFIALMFTVEKIITPSLKPSIQMQQAFRVITFGIPILIITVYGYITKNKLTSTLSGVFLMPLSFFYIDIIFDLFNYHFIRNWLSWKVILDLIPFMLIYGLVGHFASRGTKISLLIAIFIGIPFIFFILGID